MFVQQRFLRLRLSLLSIVLLGSCTTLPPAANLPEAEQKLYRVYRPLMTRAQAQTYLALPTPAARDAFANRIGVAQRLDALPARERAAVIDAHPFDGMSSQALYLLWGEPYLREGPAADERWWYFGDYFSLLQASSRQGGGSTVMEVSIENGIVKWWAERIPSDERRFRFRPPFLHRPDW